jgi:hypothetical protein
VPLDLLKQDPCVRGLALRQLRDADCELLEPLAYGFWYFPFSRSLTILPMRPFGNWSVLWLMYYSSESGWLASMATADLMKNLSGGPPKPPGTVLSGNLSFPAAGRPVT